MNAKLKRDALAIFKAGVAAADPSAAVERALRKLRPPAGNIYVVGAGKASGAMAKAAERVLGSKITAGCVAVKDGDPAKSRRIKLVPCGHPVPDARGVDAAKRIADICAAAGDRDLVIFLLSGGASALLPAPIPPVTLAEKQETTRLLLGCGATINQMNAVRKHLSLLKGGRLARIAHSALVVSLILSDVIGDPLDVIGSGPTAPDPSTYGDALTVLDAFNLRASVPANVRAALEAGTDETPKPGDPVFARVGNRIIGSNRQSLNAAAKKAKALGYKTIVLASTIEGETRDVARMHAAIARQISSDGQPIRPPACLISGGETTVTIRGAGKGGRNQEFALAAAMDIDGLDDVVILSAGTDGTDGPTDAAGALASGDTCRRSSYSAVEALARNDSYSFFEPLGDLVMTGPTGTNVMDLHIVLAGRR